MKNRWMFVVCCWFSAFSVCAAKVVSDPEKVTGVKLHSPGNAVVELAVTRDDKFACVTIPELEGWDAVWVEIP